MSRTPQPCPECGGSGYYEIERNNLIRLRDCPECGGRGWDGIVPSDPMPAPPGPARVPWLAARARLKMPLWIAEDESHFLK